MSTTETFHGYIETTRDSLLIFEACRRGLLPRVSRRLQEKERQLVKSGAVFCFDENESGIKRWTDGLVWSPSRILGNFLVYRELDKRAPANGPHHDDPKATSACIGQDGVCMNRSEHQRERALVGSLTSSYRFKRNGLIKKSMSLVVDGVQQHLISYYAKEDVLAAQLPTPSKVPHLATLDISPELLVRQNFRIPLFLDTDASVEVRMLARQSQDAGRRHPPSDDLLDDSPQPNTGRTRRRYTSLSYPVPFRRNSASPAARERSSSIEPVLSSSSSSSCHTNMKNDTCICGGRRRPEARPYLNVPLDMPPPSHQHLNTSNNSGFARSEPQSYDMSHSAPPPDYHLYESRGSMSSESSSQEDMAFLSSVEMPIMPSASPLTPSETGLSDPHPLPAAHAFSKQQPEQLQRKSSQEQQQQQQQQQQPHSLQQLQKQHLSLTSMPTYHSSAASSFYPNQPMMLMGQLGHEQTRDQNPHQHLFSSTSFHSINHSAVPMRTDIIANAFMFDPAALLGSGWNEFEMQL